MEFSDLALDNWFWARNRAEKMKKGICDTESEPYTDRFVLELVLRAMYTNKVYRGDGKFDRVYKYVSMVSECLDITCNIWKNEEAFLTGYLCGIKAAYEAINEECFLIKYKKRR